MFKKQRAPAAGEPGGGVVCELFHLLSAEAAHARLLAGTQEITAPSIRVW